MACMLYVHGGGWVLPGHEANLSVVGCLARGTGLKTYSISYPLAPDSPFPAAVVAVMRALSWLRDAEGHTKVRVVGESAGANISTMAIAAIQNAEVMRYIQHAAEEQLDDVLYPEVDGFCGWVGV